MPKVGKKKSGKTKPIESRISWNYGKGNITRNTLDKLWREGTSSGEHIKQGARKAWDKALKQDRKAKRTSNSWAKALERDRNKR